MVQIAKSPYKGRLRWLPEDRKVLKRWYPGWAALVEKLSDRGLRAKDIRRILGLTYRQIYHWHTRKLLWYQRDSQTEWRRFSIADVFGLALVKRAADLGISFDKLQKSFAVGMGVPTALWNALPDLVAGRDYCLCTDFENICSLGKSGSKLKTFIDPGTRDPIIVLPLQPILRDLATKLGLPDFKVSVNKNGSYSFEINGVPLRIEDRQLREADIQESDQSQKPSGRTRRGKHK